MLITGTVFFLLIGIVWIVLQYIYSKKTVLQSSKIATLLFNDKVAEYAITLIFTIVGVILALWLTNADTSKTNRADAEKMLNALRNECSIVDKNIAQFYLPLVDQLQEQEKVDDFIVDEYRAQPLIPAVTFENVLNSELVITNIHSASYTVLVDCYRSSEATYARLEGADTVERLIFELNAMQDGMEFCIDIINIELDNPKLSENKIKAMLEEYYEYFFTKGEYQENSIKS